MDKDRIKGKVDEIKGSVKQRIGGATKDRSTQAEGFVEEQKGKLQSGVGKMKDEARAEHEKRREPEEP
ncbi:MAG TPA: CsbD family protein [Anaeromyxobacter sp.]